MAWLLRELALDAQRTTVSLAGSPGAVAGLAFGEPAHPLEAIFLHANGFCASAYRAMLAPLGRAHRVLAVDQRGHGRTSLPAEPLGRSSWRDLADDLVGLLDGLAGGPLVLSGHSMGATVAILAAAARPGRVRSLVLFDPVLLPPDLVAQLSAHPRGPEDGWPDLPLVQGALRRREVFEGRAAAVRAFIGRGAFRTWPEGAIADYAEDGVLEQPDGTARLACAPRWEASNYCAQGHDGWTALRALGCPVRVMRAEQGSTCDPDAAAAVARECPGVTVEVVAGATHFIPMERPELAGAALASALGP
jgi:pimeloyl-ACP methyl ester carboxylesterase